MSPRPCAAGHRTPVRERILEVAASLDFGALGFGASSPRARAPRTITGPMRGPTSFANSKTRGIEQEVTERTRGVRKEISVSSVCSCSKQNSNFCLSRSALYLLPLLLRSHASTLPRSHDFICAFFLEISHWLTVGKPATTLENLNENEKPIPSARADRRSRLDTGRQLHRATGCS